MLELFARGCVKEEDVRAEQITEPRAATAEHFTEAGVGLCVSTTVSAQRWRPLGLYL
jgi:hypothetical protein